MKWVIGRVFPVLLGLFLLSLMPLLHFPGPRPETRPGNVVVLRAEIPDRQLPSIRPPLGMFFTWLLPASLSIMLGLGGVWLSGLISRRFRRKTPSESCGCAGCGEPVDTALGVCLKCGGINFKAPEME